MVRPHYFSFFEKKIINVLYWINDTEKFNIIHNNNYFLEFDITKKKMKQRDRVGSLKHNERQLDYLRKKEAVSFSFIFWEENVNYKKTK